MTRLALFATVAAIAALGACAHNNKSLTAQMVEPTVAEAVDSQGAEEVAAAEPSVESNRGQLTVAGIDPAQALGAIDTQKIVENPTIENGGQVASGTPTPTAQGVAIEGVAIEGVDPAAVLAAVDTTKLVGEDKDAAQTASADMDRPAEIQAVIDGGKYTTKDLALAQLEAVRNSGG
jgi:hypothetical protein